MNIVYNPNQPWESAYNRGMHGISSMEYWHEYLEETCVAVLTKCRNIEAFVEGDAPIAANGFHLPSVGAFAPSLAASASTSGAAKRGAGEIWDSYPPPPDVPKRPRGGTQHHVADDGERLSRNRNGNTFRAAF